MPMLVRALLLYNCACMPRGAGAAITTVKSRDGVKVITVRGTSFDPVTGDDSSAAVDALDGMCACQQTVCMCDA